MFLVGACQSERDLPHQPTVPVEANWLSSDADVAAILTEQPAPCLRIPTSSQEAEHVAQGEILFGSPHILGGQAARKGLSCTSCHRNGRDNPDFFLTGLSGAVGTVDTSHGLFGPLREDNIFNPQSIPDLVTNSPLLQSRDGTALTRFLSSQIVEEFQGAPPSMAIIERLNAYLFALDPTRCATHSNQPLRWQDDFEKARHAYSASLQAQDEPLRQQLQLASRHYLGQLHARFVFPEHATLRKKLIDLSRSIQKGETYRNPAFSDLYKTLEVQGTASFYEKRALDLVLQKQGHTKNTRPETPSRALVSRRPRD